MKADEHKRMLMVTALWLTWSERNLIREEGKRRLPQMLASYVEFYVKENAMPCVNVKNTQHSQPVRWKKKPPTNFLKLNCDASFRTGSWGALIRDVVLSRRGRIDHLLNAFQVELKACLQGVQMAVNMGRPNYN